MLRGNRFLQVGFGTHAEGQELLEHLQRTLDGEKGPLSEDLWQVLVRFL
jgi:hypothetical protein